MRKGGVAGGVKNAKFSGKTRFKVVKGGQFERILVGIVRVWAHLSQNRASSSANVTKKDHFGSTTRILMPHPTRNGGFSARSKASVNHPLHRSADASRFSHKPGEILANLWFLN